MEHCNFLPFPDICHLSCIFLAEQDIKITFSLGPKIGWYKINTVCISAASSPEPLSAALLTPRSHCSFYRTRWFPGGFIMRVFKRGSLIFLPLVGVLLVRPGHEKGKSFFQSLAVHRECVVWTLFYLKKKKKWKQTKCWASAHDTGGLRRELRRAPETVFRTKTEKPALWHAQRDWFRRFTRQSQQTKGRWSPCW